MICLFKKSLSLVFKFGSTTVYRDLSTNCFEHIHVLIFWSCIRSTGNVTKLSLLSICSCYSLCALHVTCTCTRENNSLFLLLNQAYNCTCRIYGSMGSSSCMCPGWKGCSWFRKLHKCAIFSGKHFHNFCSQCVVQTRAFPLQHSVKVCVEFDEPIHLHLTQFWHDVTHCLGTRCLRNWRLVCMTVMRPWNVWQELVPCGWQPCVHPISAYLGNHHKYWYACKIIVGSTQCIYTTLQ